MTLSLKQTHHRSLVLSTVGIQLDHTSPSLLVGHRCDEMSFCAGTHVCICGTHVCLPCANTTDTSTNHVLVISTKDPTDQKHPASQHEKSVVTHCVTSMPRRSDTARGGTDGGSGFLKERAGLNPKNGE